MNSPPSNNSWIGRLIGDNQRYRLEKRLGGGGMGEVFLATDTRVGKDVALKLLKDKLVASGEMRKRFEREISICAALQSDHIIEISDCGVTTEGYPFYVMEYLRGQTLRQLLMRERQLPPERVVKIMTQVCKGLQLAHRGVIMQRDGNNTERIKVIHRDLKPDNIFLVPTEFGEWVKILDFGIAKIYSESSEHTNLTKTFIGTFRYSSPEQIQNDKNIDVSADIYSLGIILYEMLSAADPFGLSIKGEHISEPSWLLAHSYEPPRPLRSQPGCEQLSLELEAVVIKCLQKKPSNRFASVSELSQALETAIKRQTNTGTLKSTTIVQPRPQPQGGSQNETVPRPVPVSNDETVDRPLQPPQNKPQQGSNQETINKPLQPPQNQPQQGSNQETINKPLQPPQNPLFSQLFQQSPASPNPVAPEGTVVQPRVPSSENKPTPPDKTLFQPRPGTNSGNQDIDNTIMQQPPRATNNQIPDNTILQPKPTSNNAPQQAPDGTILQPRKDKPKSDNSNTLKMFGIAFAIALILGVIFFIVANKKPQNNENRTPVSVLPKS
ncbi:serine/threonine protein kinase [Calothrix sp. NIES-4071]|nr:serine/threonine protein kinase [Calothrix sp. NIES-4071]BAZ62862.1 serine/threonine protein kinase [Calothrix sp. NIES-4105]